MVWIVQRCSAFADGKQRVADAGGGRSLPDRQYSTLLTSHRVCSVDLWSAQTNHDGTRCIVTKRYDLPTDNDWPSSASSSFDCRRLRGWYSWGGAPPSNPHHLRASALICGHFSTADTYVNIGVCRLCRADQHRTGGDGRVKPGHDESGGAAGAKAAERYGEPGEMAMTKAAGRS